LPRNNPGRAIEKLKALQKDYPQHVQDINMIINALLTVRKKYQPKPLDKKKLYFEKRYEKAVYYSVADMQSVPIEGKLSSLINYFNKNKISLSPIERGIIQKFKRKRYLSSKEVNVIENAIIYHKIDIVFMRDGDLLKNNLSLYQNKHHEAIENVLKNITLAKK